MIALDGIALHSELYESQTSLVYRGVRVQDARPIIVKLLKQDYPSPQELTRYKQEYEITRSLDLGGVIKAYDQQAYQRTLVILIEDFGGESLERWMQQRSDFCPMPLDRFLRLAIGLADILGDIHAAHVIHKDINPGNIILNPDTGVVKIIDFGIATRFNRTNPMFNSPHKLEGTLAYLSPEQTGRMNRALDYRTDFYSLGVTFYELLTGQLPFVTADVLELVHCHIAQQPVSPCELNAAIPAPVSDIVLKLMAKNAEDRYQSAQGLKSDLEICAQQLATRARIDLISLGLQDISDQFQIPQKLYGRDSEVALLLAAFDRVAYSGDNSKTNAEMMLVSGYSGVGKSALVQELYGPITAKRGYFISGKFDQLRRNIPYSAIAQALQKLVRQLLSEPDEQLKRWRSRLLAALGNNGQLIIDVIPEVELITGKQSPVLEVGATAAQNRFNRVFQQFVRAFCAAEHPLVIFLDDLQWVDLATLKLIELMMADGQTQHLFLMGAYRNNEVSPSHRLMVTLEELRKEKATIHQITLEPLELSAIAHLIADTLHTDSAVVMPLAELVLRKTRGNPFFTNEFLKTLYTENLLRFDFRSRSWRWDISQIEGKNITDNVVELMIGKLKKMPSSIQQILQLAACVGADFNLSTLSIVCERSPNDLFLKLLTAVHSSLIVPMSELDERLLVQDYRFLHDRVQQAAYALIDRSQKQIVHLRIGRSLLEKTPPEQMSERLFDIVDHLNYGSELISNQAESVEVARLNLLIGQKAKAAAAHSAALRYFMAGIGLLTVDSWQLHSGLTLSLYEEAAEAAYLSGDIQQMEHLTATVLEQANNVLDKIKVYETKIQTCMVQGKQTEAIQIGLEVLTLLGIALPETPTEVDVQRYLNETVSYFSTFHIEDLLEMPLMREPDKLAAMQILSSLVAAGHQASPLLLSLTVLEQINLSARYGNTAYSAHAYAAYGGLILNGVMGDFEGAYQFGSLALSLAERLENKKLNCKVLEIVAGHILHCKDHIRHTLPILQRSYDAGLETGDVEFSLYAASFSCLHSYFAGFELTSVIETIRIYSDGLSQFKQENALTYLRRLQQITTNLRESVEHPGRLLGDQYNEDHFLPIHLEANDRTHLHHLYLDKLVLSYLFENIFQAVEYAAEAERYLDGVVGNFSIYLFYFYDSLAQMQLYPHASPASQKNLLLKLTRNQEKMQRRAYSAPANFQHKYDLVEAEKARVLDQFFEAEECYEQAIRGARENEYLQEEALAYELAAKHYLARGREKIAQTYMKEAHYCYEHWGATAKVKDLEARYPQFFPQSSDAAYPPARKISTASSTFSNRSDVAFDLTAVMKASQAISSEIELEQLLKSLMQILIENAGAQAGSLLLETTGEKPGQKTGQKLGAWVIEAACELNEGKQVCATQVLQSIPLANRLPESIVQYVIRTHESVILNNAAREGNFTHDSYIQQHQTQSLFCLPLLNQSKLVGVLYLENQLAAGVFTPERFSEGDATRTQVLNLLSTQAAIAIENARLYSRLRASESQMAQFLEAMPVGVVVMDAQGCPYYFNQRATQLTGKGAIPSATLGQLTETYQTYVAGTDQKYPTEKLAISRALRGERTRTDDLEIHRDGTIIPVEIWGTPVFDEQGSVAYAITAFQDITERKQSEQLLANYNRTLERQVAERTAALQASEAILRDREQELRLITDGLPACIFYTDANYRYRFVNKTCEEWFGYSRDDIIGRHGREILGEVAYQAVEPYIKQVLGGELVTYETELFYASGKKHISATYIPDVCADGRVRGYYGLITDISDRKLAEAASILEERNRMAREIHDTLAQSFTGILVQVGGATQVIGDDLEATQAHLELIDELARTGLAEARRSVAALRPQLLEDGNLHSALHRLVTQMSATVDTTLTYEVKGTAYPLPADVENNLLRIGQEALTNAIKYADASEIRIELVYEPAQYSLHIADNGRGFGVGNLPAVGGFGLLGMSERAESMGAQLMIKSQPGQGTKIVVVLNRG